MTKHLSPDELIDALDGALAGDRMTHAGECAECNGRMTELRSALGTVVDHGDVPEPSPVAWDVLANRIRTATAAEPVPATTTWRRTWKPLVALGAMAATAILAVLLRTPASAPSPTNTATVPSVTVAESTPTENDYAWELVVTMAATLPHETLHEVAPASPATAVLIEDLTPRERAAFVKLIQREMSGLE